MKKTIWFGLFLLLGFSWTGFAQSMGSINGRVTDPTGAVVPGATVTATNAGTGAARTTVTSSDGQFTVSELIPGAYNVTVEKTGFAKSEKEGTTLVTGTTLTLDFALGLAGTAEKVEVTTEAPMVDVTQSEVSGALETSEVQNLPILNRNFAGLVTLIPGARPTVNSTNNKISLGGGIGFGGSAGRAGGATVDGVAFRDDAGGGTLFNLTLEGVQEFSVLVHDFGAQYGTGQSAVVLITTKSGTNQVHGSAFAFGRSQSMTALDYFSNPANNGLGKPPYDREQYGGSLGAPIIKDKLFAFGAIERLQQDQAELWNSTAYTQAQTAKTALTALTSCPVCVQIGNAIVPAGYAPTTLADLMSTGRADYQINTKHSLFFRSLTENTTAFDDVLYQGGLAHPDNDPNGSNDTDPITAQSGVLSETWVINNRSVNTIALAGNHIAERQTCSCNLTGGAAIYRDQAYPDLQLGEPTSATNAIFVQTDLQLRETYTHQMGKHALAIGGDFMDYPEIGYDNEHRGSITFFDDPSTIVNNANGKYPQGYLTPGIIKSMTTSTVNFGGGFANGQLSGAKELSGFFQDDWKVKHNLTLNLGLQYSVDIGFYGQPLQSQSRAIQILQAAGSIYGAGAGTPSKDFSPRVGFAWDMAGNGKNVIRGSFGIYFDESLAANMLNPLPLMRPTLQNVSATYTNTNYGVGQLATTVFGETAVPTLAPGLTQLVAGGSSTLTSIDPRAGNPYNEQAHIGYTRQLTSSTVLSADFTHILGLHDIRSLPVNPIESPNWDPNYLSYENCPNVDIVTGKTDAYRRLTCSINATGLAVNTVGAVNVIMANNRSQYNELNLHFEQRSRRVNLQATYTLSSAYAFGGTIGGTGTGGGASSSDIPFQWFTPSEWGPTTTDERHRVVVSAVFNLPWGITASPISQFATARPYNCTAGGADWTGSGSTTDRCWINSSGAFVTPNVANLSSDTIVNDDYLRGQPSYNLDTRVTKVVSIKERLKVNAFAEFFNITNRANFGNTYGGTFSSTTTFEKPTGYLNNGLSLPTSRQLQLGARITF